MNSSAWIHHFYSNFRSASRFRDVPPIAPHDAQTLQMIRPGHFSRLAALKVAAAASTGAIKLKDPTFAWAVRLFTQEQLREQDQLRSLLQIAAGSSAPGIREAVCSSMVDLLPPEALFLFFECRARVASRYLLALEHRSESAKLRAMSNHLAAELIAQSEFARFAAERFGNGAPAPMRRYAGTLLTLAVASRIWLRQRSRLRQAGQTFEGFLTAVLGPA